LRGKLVMECVLETKAATILQFIGGLRGSLHVTSEVGTCAAWLHDLLKPHVAEVLVCDPRENALMKIEQEQKVLTSLGVGARACRISHCDAFTDPS